MTDAEAEAPALWPPHVKNWLTGKDLDVGRDWGAGREGDDRGWDSWMASQTRWTWVWARSAIWLLTLRPGVLQSMGLQRVGHHWETELICWYIKRICLPMQEIQVWSLGWEDLLEKKMATHSSILAWRIPLTEKPGGLQPWGHRRAGHNLATKQFSSRKDWSFLIHETFTYSLSYYLLSLHNGLLKSGAFYTL